MTFWTRRAGAHRALLALVVLLVAAIAATSGLTLAMVSAATTDAARRALGGAEPAALVVTTRVADDADAQDASLRAAVDGIFAGAPVAVERAELPGDGDTPFVVWTLTPVLDDVAPSDLDDVATGSTALRQALRDDASVAVRGVTVEGDLGDRAAAESAIQAAAAAVVTVPVAILVLVAAVALVQVARLLGGVRENEVEILVARGASPRQLTSAAAAEGIVLGVVGSVVGAGAAAGVMMLRGAGAPLSLVVVAVVTALATTAALTAVAGLQARAVARRRAADRSGRLRQAATWGTVAVVVAGAALGLLRLRSLGSPAVSGPEGVTWDPLAAVGPALALVAGGLLTLALLGPLTRAWAGWSARGQGLLTVLATRNVARSLRLAVVPVVLLVLAGGSATLAAAYAGTVEQSRTQSASALVGTDVRAIMPDSGRLSPDLQAPRTAPFAAIDGVSAASPALVEDATVEGDTLGFTALPAADVPQVVRAEGTATLAEPLAGADPFAGAPALPDGTTALELDLEGVALSQAAVSEELAGEVEQVEADLAVWLVAPDGTLVVLDAGTAVLGPEPVATRFPVELPADLEATGLRLAAVDLELGRVWTPLELTVAVREVTATSPAGDRPLELDAAWWTPRGSLPVESDGGAPGFETVLDATTPSWVRFVADPAEPADESAAVVPAVVSRAAADRWDAAVGDVLDVSAGGTSVRLQVVATTDQVPGHQVGPGALVDLATFDAAVLRTTAQAPRPAEVWIAAEPGADPATLAGAVEAEAAAQAPDPAAVDVRTASAAASADAGSPVRLAFLLAAAGATVLAVVGLAVVAVTGLSGRRGEVVVLRATGLGARGQGAVRALELAVVGVSGLVAGLVAGWALAVLAVPGLVAGTVSGAPADLVVSVPAVGGLIAVAVVGLVATVVLVGARVAAQVRDTDYRPEVR